MQTMLDNRFIGPGLFITATSYGLARYAYGLYIPIFREHFELSDSELALIASFSYGSYFLITLVGIYISARLDPRKSLILGGLAAAFGMTLIGLALGKWTLAIGVALAGVSPGLAYTPISGLIAELVQPSKQRTVYSIVNSGTSLGVMFSAPMALLLSDSWRLSWYGFAVFALVSTWWCAKVIPPVPQNSKHQPGLGEYLSLLIKPGRINVFLIAFLIGVVTSVYWTFSVDLMASNSRMVISVAGYELGPGVAAQLFWVLVGLAGFAGMLAGWVVNQLGAARGLILFQSGIAVALVLLPTSSSMFISAVSGLMFGAFFVAMAATLGMWAMEIFPESPSLGFGLIFLMLSMGQFFGPLMVAFGVERFGLSSMFLCAAAGAVFVLLLLPLVRQKKGQVPA